MLNKIITYMLLHHKLYIYSKRNMQFKETFQPITFAGQKKQQLKGSMLKITFQRFKDSVHCECRYQIPLTLQCEMMAPQGVVTIDCSQ